MSDLSPRKPNNRQLLWPDSILDIQEKLLDLPIDSPIYIVGGAVRDAFLSRPVNDLDLATSGDSIKIARQITNALKGDIYVMDAERGVARVLLDTAEGRLTIDVAAFRGDSLLSDLQGRDFTLNAIAVDLWGDLQLLIDPLGGEADAAQKLLRRCMPNSIADDPIRALRAVRQSVELKGHIESHTQADIRAHASALMDTSPERVRDEFFKLLALERPAAGLKVADALGLLEPILPHITSRKAKPELWKLSIDTVERLTGLFNTLSYRRNDNTAASFEYGMLAIQLDRFRAQINEHFATEWPNERAHTALMVLGALLHRLEDSPNIAGEVADALRLSSPEKKRLVGMVKHYPAAQGIEFKSPLAQHRYWYPLGEIGIDALLLGLADTLATYGLELVQDEWLIFVERALASFYAYFVEQDIVVNPPLFLNGDDLMAELGLEGGKIIGELLTVLREGQATGQITNREAALERAKQYLANRA
jgi:tRNA nucleotidyltransferase/poly(A) polymerase